LPRYRSVYEYEFRSAEHEFRFAELVENAVAFSRSAG